MRIVKILVILFLALLLISASPQAPKLDGAWYGTLTTPDRSSLQVVAKFQRQAGGWAGNLVIENGMPFSLKDVTVAGNSISFSVVPPGEPGRPAARFDFKGSLAPKGDELSGEFIQGPNKFAFKLNRTAVPKRPDEGAAAIDPNELIEMMTSVSGPLSERPFVPPVVHPAIEYGIRPSHDPVAALIADMDAGKVKLKFEGEDGYLHSLLDALKIPIESQMAVFSKTSVQGAIIGPLNPRKLYFNDAVVVGYVGGGFIEMAAQDPEQGMSFYILQQEPMDKPFLLKQDRCLQCHLSRNSMDIPGMVVRTVYPDSAGMPINPLGSHLLDHRTPLEDRWGGWYVTGNAGSMKHLGNAAFTDSGEARPVTGTYSSDIVALMVFDHQMHTMNLITRTGWDFRMAAYLQSATGKRNDIIDRQLHDDVNELVDYLLFVDEAPLKNKIEGASGFAEKFAAAGPADSKRRSLRQLDLEHRLMRYPCSYMIYSAAFDALPAEAKTMIYARIPGVLSARFSSADRQTVIDILRETKKDLPEQFN